MSADPVDSNPQHYSVAFENERVRVLEYRDEPGDGMTVPHSHPDSVMITMSSFSRRLVSGDQLRELDMPEGVARWLPAQEHAGENIGSGPTHVFFIELKEPSPGGGAGTAGIGPQDS